MGLKQVNVSSSGDIELLYVLVVAYICIYVVRREVDTKWRMGARLILNELINRRHNLLILRAFDF